MRAKFPFPVLNNSDILLLKECSCILLIMSFYLSLAVVRFVF